VKCGPVIFGRLTSDRLASTLAVYLSVGKTPLQVTDTRSSMPIRPVSRNHRCVLDTSFQLYKASLRSVWPALLLVFAASRQSVYAFMHGVDRQSQRSVAALAIYRQPGYYLSILLGMTLTTWMIGQCSRKKCHRRWG